MTAVAMLIGPIVVKKSRESESTHFIPNVIDSFFNFDSLHDIPFTCINRFLMRQALMNAGNPIQSAVAMEVVADKYKGLGQFGEPNGV